MASATGSRHPKLATDGAATDGVAPAPRRPRRFRRRLRTRIILSFLLLGTGLTALFAFLTDYARQRVENQLVEDVMNRNIDEYARLFYVDPSRNPDIPVQQMYGRVVRRADFEQLRVDEPDWYELPDGIHTIIGRDGRALRLILQRQQAGDRRRVLQPSVGFQKSFQQSREV